MSTPGCQRSQTVSWAKHSGRWVPSLTHVSTWSGPSSFALPIRRRSHLIEGLAQTTKLLHCRRLPGPSGYLVTRSKPLLQLNKPSVVHEIWGSRLRSLLPWMVRGFSGLWGPIQNGPQFMLMKRWSTASSIISQTMSRGHVSFKAPCWPKAVIPNMGLSLCTAPLQRSGAPIA